jgi:iron complex transport system ATP-binding protein
VHRLGRPDEVIRPDVLNAVYQCHVLVDRHPVSGLPRVTLPGRSTLGYEPPRCDAAGKG